jgi:hypothetical protein
MQRFNSFQSITFLFRKMEEQQYMARPIKKRGTHYIHPVLVDEQTYKMILGHKRYHEPLGSVAHRLISAGFITLKNQTGT